MFLSVTILLSYLFLFYLSLFSCQSRPTDYYVWQHKPDVFRWKNAGLLIFLWGKRVRWRVVRKGNCVDRNIRCKSTNWTAKHLRKYSRVCCCYRFYFFLYKIQVTTAAGYVKAKYLRNKVLVPCQCYNWLWRKLNRFNCTCFNFENRKKDPLKWYWSVVKVSVQFNVKDQMKWKWRFFFSSVKKFLHILSQFLSVTHQPLSNVYFNTKTLP